MGWASGSSLFSDIIDCINDCDIDEETRKLLYEKLIPIFEDEDCDTLQECLGEDKAFDQVYSSLYPQEEEEDFFDFDEKEEGC
jgi:hypothetical protein